jgi:hypothetical protein
MFNFAYWLLTTTLKTSSEAPYFDGAAALAVRAARWLTLLYLSNCIAPPPPCVLIYSHQQKESQKIILSDKPVLAAGPGGGDEKEKMSAVGTKGN